MKQLLEMYQTILTEESLASDDAGRCRVEKLKYKLLIHFGPSLVFHKQQASNKSELVYSAKIQIKDVINRAIELNEMHEFGNAADISHKEKDSVPKILYYIMQLKFYDPK